MKKQITRIAAATVAFASAIALAVAGAGSAIADDITTADGSITINAAAGTNAVDGHTFKAVQLATYNVDGIDQDANSNYKGVNVTTVSGLATPIATAATAAGVSPLDATNPMASVVKQLTDSGSSPYSGNLRTFVTALAKDAAVTTALATAPSTTGTKDQAAFTDLPEGLYLIVDTTAVTAANAYSTSIPMLVGTKINGHDLTDQTLGVVDVKNELPTLNKTLVSPSANAPFVRVGSDVEWNLTGSVPNYTGYTTYDYVISDTLSAGLSYNADKALTVTVGGKQLTAGTDYTLKSVVNADKSTSLTVDLSASIMKQTIGAPIVVDYHSTVTTDVKVIDDILNNNAFLTYSNNPASDSHGTTVPVSKHLFIYGFNLLKQDKSTAKALAGAGFTVTQSGGTAPLTFSAAADSTDGHYVYDPAGSTTTLTTPASGELAVGGLAPGTYTVQETVAPAGYTTGVLPSFTITITGNKTANANTSTQLSDGAPTYTFKGDTWGLSSWSDASATVTVDNVTSLAQLPLTGGAGIVLFGAIAVVLAATAGIVLIKAKKSERSI